MTEPGAFTHVASRPGSARTRKTHVVATWGADGVARIYVDGVEQGTETIPGDLSVWNPAFRLGVGDELTTAISGGRPFEGTIHLAAIYARELSAREVAGNFRAGIK